TDVRAHARRLGTGSASVKTLSNGSTSADRQSERRNLRRVEANRTGPFLKKGVRESRPFFYSKARLSLQVQDSGERKNGNLARVLDRKSTRLNSSHVSIS